MVACFALLLGYHGSGRGELSGSALKALACYVDDCLIDLARGFSDSPLVALLRHYAADIENLAPGESLDLRLADYFYHFIAHEPFASFAKNENRARNLTTFFSALSIFQNYYHYNCHYGINREQLRFHFFQQL